MRSERTLISTNEDKRNKLSLKLSQEEDQSLIGKNFRFLLHELLEVGDEELRPIADTVANDVAAVSDEAVSWWSAFKVGSAISNHHNLQLTVGLQLTRVEISDLRDCFAFSSASACWLVAVKSAVVTVEVEEQFVGEQVVEWNV